MRWIAVSVVCAIAVAGCGLPVAADPPKPVVTTKAPVKKKAAALSAAQAKRALLTLNDMPTGWTLEKPKKGDNGDGDDDGTVTPKRCQALLDAGDNQGDKPLAEAEVSFNARAMLLKESVASFSTPQVSDLNKLAYAFRQCPKITTTYKDGRSETIRAGTLSFPNLGDRTVAVRFTTRTRGVTVVMDLVIILKGSNGISIMAGGIKPFSRATLEKLARKAVARVDLVAG